MAKKFGRILVIFLLVICSSFGLYACGDPYADMSVNIKGAEFGNVGGTKHLVLDLSSDDTSKIVLTADVINLKSGMATGVQWSTTDASRVAIRQWEDNGVCYVELTATRITNADSYVTITAKSRENASIMDKVKVTVTMPVTSMEVIEGTLGIPLGVDYVLNPEDFVTFKPSGASIPNCIFEIGSVKYKSGDIYRVDPEGKPESGMVQVRCYPEDQVDDNGDFVGGEDAIFADFDVMLYVPISAESILVENILPELNNEGGESVTEIELIINGEEYQSGITMINPNKQTYAVLDVNNTAIEFDVLVDKDVLNDVLDVSVDMNYKQFTVMGLDVTNEPIEIKVVAKVAGIANAPEIVLPITVKVMKYPSDIVLMHDNANINELILNHTSTMNQEKMVAVSLTPLSQTVKQIRLELDYENSEFNLEELSEIEIGNFESDKNNNNLTPEVQANLRRIIKTFGLRLSSNDADVTWKYIDEGGDRDGIPYITFDAPETLRFKNFGIVMGKVAFRLVLIQSENKNNMTLVEDVLNVVLQHGIESFGLDENTQKLVDSDENAILMMAQGEYSEVGIGLKVITPSNAKISGIKTNVVVKDKLNNVVTDALEVVPQTDDNGVVYGRFDIFAKKPGEYKVQFEADTGVTFVQNIKVYNPVTEFDVKMPNTYQDAVGEVVLEDGKLSVVYMKANSNARILTVINPNGGDYADIVPNSENNTFARIGRNANNEYFIYTYNIPSATETEVKLYLTLNTYAIDGNRKLVTAQKVKEFVVRIFKPISSMSVTQEHIDLDWRRGSQGVYVSTNSFQEVDVRVNPTGNTTKKATDAIWEIIYNPDEIAKVEYLSANADGTYRGSRAKLGIDGNKTNQGNNANKTGFEYRIKVSIKDYKQTFEKIITVKVSMQTAVSEIVLNEVSQGSVDAYYGVIPGVTNIKGTKENSNNHLFPSPLIVNFDLNKKESFVLDVDVLPSNAAMKDVAYFIFDMEKTGEVDANNNAIYSVKQRGVNYHYSESLIQANNASLKLNRTTNKWQIEANKAGYAVVLLAPKDIMTNRVENIVNYEGFVGTDLEMQNFTQKYKVIIVRVADGSEELPYELRTAQDIADLQSIGGTDSLGIYKLMDNIDMSRYFESNTWTGIGSEGNAFNGKIYSDSPTNLTIYGWNITKLSTKKDNGYMDSVAQNFGIFNYLGKKAEISNIDFVIENYNIEQFNTYYEIDDSGATTTYKLSNIGILAGINEGVIDNINVRVKNYNYTNIINNDFYNSTDSNDQGTVNLGFVGHNYAGRISNVDISINSMTIAGVNATINSGVIAGKNSDDSKDKVKYYAQVFNNTIYANIKIINSEKKLNSKDNVTNTVKHNIGMLVGVNESVRATLTEQEENGAVTTVGALGGILGGKVTGKIIQAENGTASYVKDYYNEINMGGVVGLNGGDINYKDAKDIPYIAYIVYEYKKQPTAENPDNEVRVGELVSTTDYALTESSVTLRGIGNIGGIIGLNDKESNIYNVKYRINAETENVSQVADEVKVDKGIRGIGNIGGIIGSVVKNEVTITNAYVVGYGQIADVVALSSSVVGGIVGNVGKVEDDDNVYGNLIINNAWADIDIVESKSASGTIAGMMLGQVSSSDNELNYVHTHGSITLNANGVAGSVIGNISGSIKLYKVYAATTVDGETSYVTACNGTGTVNTDDDTCYLAVENWETVNYYNLTNNGFYEVKGKNYNLPYTMVTMAGKDEAQDWLEIVPTKFDASTQDQNNGQYNQNGTYNKTTEGSADIEKITVFGDAFTKTDTEIVLRYKAGKVYNLFSENKTGLFKLVVLPKMLLNDVNVVIESSASNVVGLLPSGKLSNYRIELLNVGTSVLTVRSSHDASVKVELTIHIIQGFDDLNIMDNGSEITNTSSVNIIKGNSYGLKLDYIEYYNEEIEKTNEDGESTTVEVTRIKSVNDKVNGGVAIYIDKEQLFDSEGNPYFKINGMEYIIEGDYAVVYVSQVSDIMINALLKTENAITMEFKPFFTYKSGDSVERIMLDSVGTYNVNIFTGPTGLSVDTSDIGIYAGETLEMSAELITDYVSDDYQVDLTVYKGNTTTGTLIWTESSSSVKNIFRITENKLYVTKNIKFAYMLEVLEAKRYDITEAQVYTLVFKHTRQGDNQVFEYIMQLTIYPQKINSITIEHFSDVIENGDNHSMTGAGNQPTNSIVAGEFGLLRVNVAPDYASYDYIEVTSSTAFGDSISMERREYVEEVGSEPTYVQYDAGKSNSEVLDNGIRINNVKGDNNGIYYIRTIVSTNISTSAVFDVTVTAWKVIDGVPTRVAISSQPISVRVLAKFELKAEKFSDKTNLGYVAQGTGNNLLTINIDTSDKKYTNLLVTADNNASVTLAKDKLNNQLVQYYYVSASSEETVGTKFTITATADIIIDGITRTITKKIQYQVVDYYIENSVLENLSNYDAIRKSIYLPHIQDRYTDLTIWGSLLDEGLTGAIAKGNTIDVTNIEIPSGISVDKANSTNVTALIKTLMLINGYTYSNGSNSSDAGTNEYPTVWSYKDTGAWASIGYVEVYNAGAIGSNNKTLSTVYMTAIQQSGSNVNRYYITPRNVGITELQFNLEYTFDENGKFTILNSKSTKKVSVTGTTISDDIAKFLITQDIMIDIYQRMADDHPKPINNKNDLMNMIQDGRYILMNDIDLTPNGDDEWSPMDLNISSLDGNGYRLYVHSNRMTSGTNNTYGVFGTISANTMLNNVDVVLVNENSNEFKLKIEEGALSSLNVGIFAVNNNGILNNCQVECEENVKIGEITDVKDKNDNTKVVETKQLFTYKDATITLDIVNPKEMGASYNVAGFVNTNRGSISNSRVLNVGVSANGNVAGFVVNNYGSIASSYVDSVLSITYREETTPKKQGTEYVVSKSTMYTVEQGTSVGNSVIIIDNKTTASDTQALTSTAGFVINNYSGASIYGSYVGNAYDYVNNADNKAKSEEIRTVRINSAVYSSAFVYANSAVIEDSYVAANLRGAKITSGFVFRNTATGVITRSFTVSKPEVINDLSYTPFVGREGLSTSQPALADGDFNNCYYMNDDYYSSTALLYEKKTQAMSKAHFVNNNGQYTTDWDTYSISRTGNQDGAEFSALWVWNNEKNFFYKDRDNFTHIGPRLVGADLISAFHPRYITGTSLDGTTGDLVYSYNDNTVAFKNLSKDIVTGKDSDGNEIEVTANTYQYNPNIVYDVVTFNNKLSHLVNDTAETTYEITKPVRVVDNIDVSSEGNNLLTSTSIISTIIDGNGYTISGINLAGKDLRNSTAGVMDMSTVEGLSSFGLFREINNGVVKSMTLNVLDMSASAYNVVGSLAGVVNNAELYDITVSAKGERVLGNNLVGGVVGYVVGKSRINDITSDIRVTAVYSSSGTDNSSTKLYNKDIYNVNGQTTEYNNLTELAYAGGAFGVVDLEPFGTFKPSVYATDDVLCSNIVTMVENSIVGSVVGGVVGCVGAKTNLTHSGIVVMPETKLRATKYSGGVVGQNNGTVAYSKATYDTTYLSEVYKFLDGTRNSGTDTTSTQSKVYNANTGELVSANTQAFETPSRMIAVGGVVGINLGAKYTNTDGIELYTGIILFSNSDVYVINNNAENAGGVVGVTLGGELRAVYASGTVKGNARANVGGIIGLQDKVDNKLINNGHNYNTNDSTGTEQALIIKVESPFDGFEPDYTLSMDFVVAQNNWASAYYDYYAGLTGGTNGNIGAIVGKVTDIDKISSTSGGSNVSNYFNYEITKFVVDKNVTGVQADTDRKELNSIGKIENSGTEKSIATAMVRGAMIASGQESGGIYSQWDVYSRNGIHADGTPNIKSRVAPEEINITKIDEFNTIYWRPDLRYVLMDDLDFEQNDGDEKNDKYYNMPGSGSQAFTGTFNGNGNTISNINVTNSTATAVGLFGTIKGGTIKDVIFKDIIINVDYINTNNNSVGGVVGVLQGGVLQNINVENLTLTTNGVNAGGIVGSTSVLPNVDNAIDNVNITGLNFTYNTNGLLGKLANENNTSETRLSVVNVGGLVGKSDKMGISASSVVGKIKIIETVDKTKMDNIQTLNVGGVMGTTNAGISTSVVNLDIEAITSVVNLDTGDITTYRQNNLNIGGLFGELTSVENAVSNIHNNITMGNILVQISNEVDAYTDGAKTSTVVNNIETNIGGIAGVDKTQASYRNNLAGHNIILKGDVSNPNAKNIGGWIGKIAEGTGTYTAYTNENNSEMNTSGNYIAVGIFDNTTPTYTTTENKTTSNRLITNAYFGSMKKTGADNKVNVITKDTFATDPYYTNAIIDGSYDSSYKSSYDTINKYNLYNLSNIKNEINKKDTFWTTVMPEGSKFNPIIIKNAGGFAGIDTSEYKYYVQTENISVSSAIDFTGYYNGNGYTITANDGVFGSVSEFGSVNALNNYPSVITGVKVVINGTKSLSDNAIFGGIVNTLGENCFINASGSQGDLDITSGNNVVIGGVVGVSNGAINNCYNAVILRYTGASTNTITMGGIVGEIKSNRIYSNLYGYRNLASTTDTFGGIVGKVSKDSTLLNVLSHSTPNQGNCIYGSSATNVNVECINVVIGVPDGNVDTNAGTFDKLNSNNAIWCDVGEWSALEICKLGIQGTGELKDPYRITNIDDLQNFLLFNVTASTEKKYYLFDPDESLKDKNSGTYIYDMANKTWIMDTAKEYSVVLMVKQGQKIVIDNVGQQLFGGIGKDAVLIREYDENVAQSDSATEENCLSNPTNANVLTINTEVGNVLGNTNNGTIQGVTIKLLNDIDASSMVVGTNNGTITNVVVDGDSKILTGIKDDTTTTDVNESDNTGGVVSVNGGTISNTSVNNITIKGTNYVGGIAGVNNKNITNANVNNLTVEGAGYTGGVAGKTDINTSITASVVNSTITATGDYAGGVAGENLGSITANVTNTSVTAVNNAGGIVGINNIITIKSNTYTGSVAGTVSGLYISSTGNASGGIAGYNEGTISGCDVTASNGENLGINASTNAGGITGVNNGTLQNNTINNVKVDATDNAGGIAGENNGTISGTVDEVIIIATGDNAGGIAGTTTKDITGCTVKNATIKATNYAGGVVSKVNIGIEVSGNTLEGNTITATNEYAGGIAGENNGTISGSVSNCTVSAVKYAGGIAGKTTTVLTNPSVTSCDISGASYIGGIVGENTTNISGASVTNTSIIGQSYVGGVSGNNTSTIDNANVQNLTITGTVKDEENNTIQYLGGIAGYSTNSITGAKVSGLYISSTGNASGGIAGYNTGTISGCEVTASNGEKLGINAGINAGGITGVNRGTLENNTINNVKVDATDNAGGITGKNIGSINGNNKVELSTITATGDNAGGIAGKNASETIDETKYTGTITGASVEGCTISARDDAGGIAGSNSTSITSVTVQEKDTTNTTVTTKGNNAGGIVGDNTGGIVGDNTGEIKPSISVNNVIVTAKNNAGGVAGSSANSVISNATVNGGIITATADSLGDNAGGIVGYLTASSNNQDGTAKTKVESCTAKNLSVIAKNNVGGIVGYNEPSSNGNIYYLTKINNCTAEAMNGDGQENIGGIVGKNIGGRLTNVEVKTSITLNPISTVGASCQYFGGIAGYNNGTITVKENTNITLYVGANEGYKNYIIKYVGGVVGYNAGTISNIVSGQVSTAGSIGSISVTAPYANYVGGIFGHNNTEVNSGASQNANIASSINITGKEYVAGIAGKNSRDLNNLNVVDATITGSNYVAGMVGENVGYINSCTLTRVDYKKNYTITATSASGVVAGFVGKNSGTINDCSASATESNQILIQYVDGGKAYYITETEKDDTKVDYLEKQELS